MLLNFKDRRFFNAENCSAWLRARGFLFMILYWPNHGYEINKLELIAILPTRRTWIPRLFFWKWEFAWPLIRL